MKKQQMVKNIFIGILFIISVVIIVALANDKPNEDGWTSHCNYWRRPDAYTKVVEIEGHKYIILTGYHMGSIVHAASCPCNLTIAK